MDRLNILVAYPYMNPQVIESLRRCGSWLRFTLDSGAFTAWKAGKPIELDDYCRFLEQLPIKPWRYFTLDVIGNPDGTLKNYEAAGSWEHCPGRTSGTFPINVSDEVWVTVSPKVDMPGGLKVLPQALVRADEIKYPVQSQRDIDVLKDQIIRMLPRPVPIWLQPISQGCKATQLCVDACLNHGWKLSIQTHKYAGVR